jgi:predicted permease
MGVTSRRLLVNIRHAGRGLRKAPLFTAVAVASMGFGIGANTTVFTLVDQVLLRSISVSRPSELVQVSSVGSPIGGMGDGTELSYAIYRDLRDHNQVLSGMFCRQSTDLYVGVGERTEQVVGELVSGTFFPVLGLRPAAGRLFTADEDRSVGDQAVAVLAYGYWQSRFGGRSTAIGQTVHVNGHPFQIVGVVQAGFDGIDIGQPAQIYVPITMQPKLGPAWLQIDTRRLRWVQVYGRMRAGLTAERTQAELQPLYGALLEKEVDDAAAGASIDTKRRFLEGRLTVTSAARGHSGFSKSVRTPLLILMAVAAGVLLIVCANVANLLIARGAARQRELALRLAVGAGRWDVIGLLLVESLLLGLGGAAAGLLLALWGASILVGFYENPVTHLAISGSPDLRIVAFNIVVAIVTAMIAGIIPALRATSVDLAPTLKSGGGAIGGERARVRKVLLVTQVSLSFVLLIGSGLFVRSLQNLLHLDLGFRTDRTLSFMFDLSRSGYNADRARGFVKTYSGRLSRLPGVSSVAYSFQPLLEGGGWAMNLSVEGYRPATGQNLNALCNAVSPGFFRTMGIPLLAGREFTERDDQPLPKGWPYRVAIVNEAFARQYLNGTNPIGRRVGLDDNPGAPTPIEVVGFVKDTNAWAIREDRRPQIFFPYLQASIEDITTYVRTEGDPMGLMEGVRREIAAMDPQLAISNVSTLDDIAKRSLTNERLIASLSGTLSLMATMLSIIGLYGVMSYSVTRRTREIGIRVALGALSSQIARAVLREAATLVGIGMGLGWGAAWLLGRYVESQLYGVTPADATTIALATVTLTAVAAIASFIPARRAANVAPMTALRQD